MLSVRNSRTLRKSLIHSTIAADNRIHLALRHRCLSSANNILETFRTSLSPAEPYVSQSSDHLVSYIPPPGLAVAPRPLTNSTNSRAIRY